MTHKQLNKFFNEKLNADVTEIIFEKIFFANYIYNLNSCLAQIRNINKDFLYYHNVRLTGRYNLWDAPRIVSQFILLKNREKISINYKRTKRDKIYEII